MEVLENLASYFSPLTLLLTLFLATLVVFWFKNNGAHKGNLPPGPTGVPLLGYLPFMGAKPHKKFDQLGKKYGPVFSLYLGRKFAVVLTDFKSVKEAFSKDEFTGRPESSINQMFDNIYTSFLDESGEIWREQRRFALHIFRDLGMGRSVMEGHILEEISDIMTKFRAQDGRPFQITEHLVPSMSNNITALLFGQRFPVGDPKREMLDRFIINEEKGAFNLVSPGIFLPWLMRIVRVVFRKKFAYFDDIIKNTYGFFRKEIQEHDRTLDENNIRDYIDGFLVEMKKRKGQKSSFHEEMLMGNAGIFFGAGSETVQVSISWLTLLMASHPDVQSRVQKEIDDVIGPHRTPQWKDNTQMPYTNAVIAEMHRWASVIPINLPRYTLADTSVGGYFIPKDTIVFANLWSVHNDPKIWENPEKFVPERFFKKKVEMVTPFSYGKRSCPGEGLANIEVFLYFVSFLQNFTISLPNGVKPDFSSIIEVSLSPTQNTFCFKERSH